MALRGKYIFKEYGKRSETGDETLLSVSEYYGVKPRGEVIDDGDFISRAESLVGYKKCMKHDLVMNIMLAWKRGLGVTKYDGIVSPAYSVFRFNENAVPDYMHYLLRTDMYTGHFKTRSTGVIDSRLRLYPESFGNVPILRPPVFEQTQIANFLDHETAKIDTLVDKQQQLIALLKEKRQAVISHAVTKGLNPDAPMKNSGVEWLGEVPEHWRVTRLKLLTLESVAGPYGSSLTKSMYTSSGIRVYGQQQVIPDDFSVGDYYISEQKFECMKRYEVFPGDVLISVMGTVGKVAVVPDGVERGIINPRLVKYRVSEHLVIPKFVQCSVLCEVNQAQLSLAAQGSTMDGLNMRILGELSIAYPPISEQLEILGVVKKHVEAFDDLLKRVAQAVDLLIERRTALISAAVTGKIDVRNWQQPIKTTANEDTP
jgi:type I restriction enzyme S subunit